MKTLFRNLFLAVFALAVFPAVYGQGTAINATGNSPDPSAMLDVSGTDKGFLMPRMTTAQRDAIVSPALGLMIFNTDCNTLNIYNGGSWIALANNSGIASPGTVSGVATPCLNSSGIAYSVASVPNATGYNWTVPPGITIASGQGTNSVQLNFGNTGGNICVNTTDACGYSSPSCLQLSILTAPSAPTASSASTFTKTSFSANWNSAPTATTYYLDVATDDSFSNIVSGYSNLNVGNVTTYPVVGLTCETPYYYRIRSENACGTSPNSNTITTSTLPCCSNEWVQRANYGGGTRQSAVGFTIGTKAYMGLGINSGGSVVADFWEWDPATNVWTQKANYGGGARQRAVAFSIGSKGYAGTGINSGGSVVSDFWEYDPATNVWTSKASFGGGARQLAVGFYIGSKGYIGTGINSGGSVVADFWEYDPALDTWTAKTSFSGGGRQRSVGFSIGTKGYIGTGINSGGSVVADFYEYDPATNAWTQKANYGGSARQYAVGFGIGSKGYIGVGVNSGGSVVSDFWEYDPAANTWISKATYAGGAVQRACGFSSGSKGYVGTGINSGGSVIQTFYEFCP